MSHPGPALMGIHLDTICGSPAWVHLLEGRFFQCVARKRVIRSHEHWALQS